MLISLPTPYLIAIQKWHCNSCSKNLLSQCCINIAPQLFSDFSIKADQTMTEQRRKYGWTSDPRQGGERDRRGEDSPQGEGEGDTMRRHLEQREPDQH